MEFETGKAGGINDIMLNMESVCSVHNGVSTVIYDDVLKQIIDKRGYY